MVRLKGDEAWPTTPEMAGKEETSQKGLHGAELHVIRRVDSD